MAVSQSASAVPLSTKRPSDSASPSSALVKKAACLLLLTVQTSTLILLMRHSLHRARYNAASVVVSVELVKLGLSLVAEFATQLKRRLHGGPARGRLNVFALLWHDFGAHRRQVLQLAVPAALYAVQNNLSYFALSRLSAVTFQVVQQLKILSTAVIAVWMLGRRLLPSHWLALWLLTAGVAIVQLSNITDDQSCRTVGRQDAWLGFGAVLLNSLSSGFAGIYFEKLVKSSALPTKASVNLFNPSLEGRLAERTRSVWIQSIELGIFGLFFSTLALLAARGEAGMMMRRGGFFHGYDYMTWIVILMQAVGGMLVALVVRYADSILKAFATSASIVLSSIVTFGLMGSELSWSFVAGASLVIVSVCIYSLADRQQARLLKTR